MESNNSSPDRARNFFKANETSNSRALIMYAVGVVIGLILGGIGLFNARGTTTNKVPEENIALVNQQPILRTDFVTQLEAETGKSFEETSRMEQLQVLDEMLREELFVQRGLELNFAETDQETRYALYAIVEAQILAGVTTSQPTEQQLREFFDTHRELFVSNGSIDVHHLILDQAHDELGEQAAQALRDGMPLEQVKQQFGADEMEYFGNEYYYLANYHLGDALFSQVSDLEPGQVLGPVTVDGEIHIVQVLGKTIPQPQSYEDAGSEVKSKFYSYEKAQRLNNVLSFLRNRSTILITDDYKDDYDPTEFQEAY